jgi:esterase/lipase
LINHAKALALFSPAIDLSLGAELIITSVKLGILSGQGSLPKLGGGSDIADPIARKKCPSYKEMPLFGVMQFDALRLKAKKELGHIEIPTFMAFGMLDSAINVKTSRQTILNEIKGPIVSKLYARSKHVISLDYDRDLLAKDLWHFINAHLRY